ncbi:MAG: NUDIX domain-containing protein, partial [Chitinophagales bacterium]
MRYRVSARGILEEDDKILFVEYKHKNMNTYYSLPGGGQEKGVNLKQTVQIEFREEVAIEVEVGDVL